VTSPITGAGTIALGLAESLSGLVMAQQKAAGHPIISGGGTMGERVKDRVTEILKTHEPMPIPDDQMAEIRKIVAAADAAHA